jgi:hypothetical protein
MENAFSAFIEDVKNHTFPAQEHTVEMPEEEWDTLVSHLKKQVRSKK